MLGAGAAPGAPWLGSGINTGSITVAGPRCRHNTMTGGDIKGVKTVVCCKAMEKESSRSRVQILLEFSFIFKQD